MSMAMVTAMGEYNDDDGDGGVTTQQRLATNESGQAVSNGNEGRSKEDWCDARREDVDNKRRRYIYTIEKMGRVEEGM